MRVNKLRQIWQSGGYVANGWLMIPNSFATELMAHQGWESLTVDMQHGMIGFTDALSMLTAISTTDCVPVVRVPWLEPGILMKVLDAGAEAVICPMVNNAEEAEQLISATHYPPRGTRSFGPVRASMYGGGAGYHKTANDNVVAFAMIETQQGLDNLEDILRVDGLEAIFVGPSDLSLALGCEARFDDLDKPAQEAIEYIAAKCKENNVIAGIFTSSPETAMKRVETGYQFVTVTSDAALISAGAQQALSRVNKGADAAAKSSY
ncbi:MAG: aldolase/citrate lyase family protein [Thiolinea sp.]